MSLFRNGIALKGPDCRGYVRVSPSDILKRGQVMVYLVGMRKILSLSMRPTRTTVTAIVLSA